MIRDILNAIRNDPWGVAEYVFGVICMAIVIGAVVWAVWGAIHTPKQVHYDNEFCHTTTQFSGFLEVNKTLIPEYSSVTTCITPVPTPKPTATLSPQ